MRLADGASQQAASVEEIGSALEETASMVRQSSENALEARNLVQQAVAVVYDANNAMRRLIEAMGEITRSSEETGKIVKTIDEIAFQTNLKSRRGRGRICSGSR